MKIIKYFVQYASLVRDFAILIDIFRKTGYYKCVIDYMLCEEGENDERQSFKD